ncbi:hypothetical protein LCGC14_2517780 [marine sediment metagenome]|uniref:Uncharacterized protein n=1 Tax=marine sediment metagenome TaxID=412755 RepID=A0A0F9BKB5_9ZZZZ
MAGMDLPANSFFFPYTGFLPHNVPGNSVHQDKDSDIPDFRNFLTWEPDIVLTPGESGTFHFNTSDRSGRYMLLIRGFTESGTYLQGITYFDVE